MSQPKAISRDPAAAGGRKHLVQDTAARMRELIFARPEGEQIGSLPELAKGLGVGIVTVQQAARILEHEGLLEVRRGPGGGYYGSRPDAADLERALAAYMRSQPASWEEALDMTSLLFNELCAAAAGSADREGQDELRDFALRLPSCASETDMGAMEQQFQDLLFRMVDRPLFELLTRVTLRFSAMQPGDAPGRGLIHLEQWIAGRRRIIDAILRRDVELARFEADRSNRQILMAALERSR
ncbi:MAG: FadR/GntR family transcriptional regulator [Novosphingobium sp.]